MVRSPSQRRRTNQFSLLALAVVCLTACGSSAPRAALSVGSASTPASSPQCRSLPPLATIRRITGYTDLVPPESYDTGQRSCALSSTNGRHSVTFQFYAGDGRTVVLHYHSGHRSRTIRDAVVTNNGRLIVYRAGHTYSVDLGDDSDPRTATQLALLRAWGKL